MIGVQLDETLSFKTHIESTAKKLSKSIYCISRAKNLLSNKSLKSLKFALIHPHLLNYINIYSCAAPFNLKRLITLQKKQSDSLIEREPALAHTQELFTSSLILPLEKLMQQAKLNFMYSMEYGYGPPTFF